MRPFSNSASMPVLPGTLPQLPCCEGLALCTGLFCLLDADSKTCRWSNEVRFLPLLDQGPPPQGLPLFLLPFNWNWKEKYFVSSCVE